MVYAPQGSRMQCRAPRAAVSPNAISTRSLAVTSLTRSLPRGVNPSPARFQQRRVPARSSEFDVDQLPEPSQEEEEGREAREAHVSPATRSFLCDRDDGRAAGTPASAPLPPLPPWPLDALPPPCPSRPPRKPTIAGSPGQPRQRRGAGRGGDDPSCPAGQRQVPGARLRGCCAQGEACSAVERQERAGLSFRDERLAEASRERRTPPPRPAGCCPRRA